MEHFRKLGISEEVLKSIGEQHYEIPSEIQEKAIPSILQGKDVIAGSATGSGKTLVFGAPIAQNIVKGQGIQALVLTPTRELAEQVSRFLVKISHHYHLSVVPVYGGVSINPQIDALPTAEVVVGTPGRILDHIERRTINLEKVKILVLDEADTMLDMGFIRDVEQIIRRCPQKRQTLLFSATITPDVARISKNYMHNPISISVTSYVDPSKLEQVYYDVEDNMKFSLLVHLLKQERSGLVMVFCNTQRNTDFVEKNLKVLGIKALAIHGGITQAKRTRTLEQFHRESTYVLVCTDVAARGLDIKGVSHVYNYDIPKEPKQYIHRIGRTARAGKEGKAVSILASRDHENFYRIQRDRSLNIVREETPRIERVMIKWKDEPRRFGREGREDRRNGEGPSRGFRGQRGFGQGFRSHGRSSFGNQERSEGRSSGFGSHGRPEGRSSGFGNQRPEGRSSGFGHGRPEGRSYGNRTEGRSEGFSHRSNDSSGNKGFRGQGRSGGFGGN